MTALYTLSFLDCLMCWLRTRAFWWPRAWLALLIRALISLSRLPSLLIMLPRYLKLSTVFSWVPSTEMVGRWATEAGAGWNRTCLAEVDGKTEEAGGFYKRVDNDLEVRLPMRDEGTVISKQCFQDSRFQSLSWLSVGNGWTGNCQAGIVSTLPVQGPWQHGSALTYLCP